MKYSVHETRHLNITSFDGTIKDLIDWAESLNVDYGDKIRILIPSAEVRIEVRESHPQDNPDQTLDARKAFLTPAVALAELVHCKRATYGYRFLMGYPLTQMENLSETLSVAIAHLKEGHYSKAVDIVTCSVSNILKADITSAEATRFVKEILEPLSKKDQTPSKSPYRDLAFVLASQANCTEPLSEWSLDKISDTIERAVEQLKAKRMQDAIHILTYGISVIPGGSLSPSMAHDFVVQSLEPRINQKPLAYLDLVEILLKSARYEEPLSNEDKERLSASIFRATEDLKVGRKDLALYDLQSGVEKIPGGFLSRQKAEDFVKAILEPLALKTLLMPLPQV